MAPEVLKTAVRGGDLDGQGEDGLAGSPSSGAARVFTDHDDHGLVQRRLGLFYGLLGIFALLFWIVGAVTSLVVFPGRFWELHGSAPKIIHIVAAIVLIGVGILFKGALRPRWLVSAGDLLGSAEIMAFASTMIVLLPPSFHGEFLPLAPLFLLVPLRAALVPSPPRWTAIVAGTVAVQAPFASYIVAILDPDWPIALAPRGGVFVFMAAWSVVATITAWAISKVVYGLRAEVKAATRLGQYTLEEKIGEGGMGIVHRARHALLRRPTAIKLLPPDRTSPTEIRRFEREVQLTSMLTHPNTVAIYDFGHTQSGVFYYAMELLDGISLQELVERDGPIAPGRVVHIVEQIAGALAEAHDVGLIHRDVKPANVFLCERGGLPDVVKVLDFGLVKEAGRSDPALSRAGAIAGTPHYMAPETITEPESIDGRVDLYALGALAFFLLTARTLFEGNNLVEICSHHLHTAPKPPSKYTLDPVPPVLERIVLRCLAKSRHDRPASARELLEELRGCHEECPWDETEARLWWEREHVSKREEKEDEEREAVRTTVRSPKRRSTG